MDYEMQLLLQEIKRCRQKMYDLRPGSNDFSNHELVKQSQMLDKLIFYYQKSILEKERNAN
ncbi:aspartyl-phosphate phosphatase Spo0E family protein [Fictibacillus sp. BK138]|uniref:aspartyl-phosphate phosphatase Spo0E family protein n=1 Tax=Fictibacillus sp. BK138 TaxID=2512121 RepID=UPI0010288A37|nr:aspartyl-phosphate phosphatase Spo0E family protein [Fictibacillus sp. BK138]RZT21649.1 Spo0E like sporulation regulatory protein [Fictibacillus sp. BK138]